MHLRVALTLLALLGPVALTASPAVADHVDQPLRSEMVGVGEGGTFSFCMPPQVRVAMVAEGIDGDWTVQWTQVWPNNAPLACPWAIPLVFQGHMNPLDGGCLPSAIEFISGQLCLGPVEVLGLTTTEWRICTFEGPGCTDGWANFRGTIDVVLN